MPAETFLGSFFKWVWVHSFCLLNPVITCVFWSLFGVCCQWGLGKPVLRNKKNRNTKERRDWVNSAIITTSGSLVGMCRCAQTKSLSMLFSFSDFYGRFALCRHFFLMVFCSSCLLCCNWHKAFYGVSHFMLHIGWLKVKGLLGQSRVSTQSFGLYWAPGNSQVQTFTGTKP